MTIKKAKKKAVSAEKGKVSVEKGKKFEDMVADIYRDLLGADVERNIMICQKKVDILATFRLPGSPTGHRVIIECKDEKKNRDQNQRVMQFKGLLDTARSAGKADSAEIITREPWSDEAKGFARDSGIVLLTYAEKMGQLLDFTAYLTTLKDRFDKGIQRPSEPPLGAYYIDPEGTYTKINKKTNKEEVVVIPSIDKHIHQWLKNDVKQRHLAILGGYGTGKTSMCQKLAHDLADMYLKEPGSARIPILFNLRNFTKTLKIESLVSSFLDEECEVANPKFRLFKAMNDAALLLLIFDGFDEMSVRVDRDTLEVNLQEIEKLAASPNTRVIITSRLEYFMTEEEERKSHLPKKEILASREIEYEAIRIKPWDNERVNAFLQKRVPLIEGEKHPWTFYSKRIRDISGLSDLSKRPVLLDMIVKTLPQLIESGKPINRPNLYETYLRGEIKRQKIKKQRTLLLSEDARFSLLKELALSFFDEKLMAITYWDSLKYVEKIVKPPKSELEAYTREFLSCSFLIREGDEFRFSHKSILEYLIAKGLMDEISEDAPVFFSCQHLEREVTSFLVELNPDRDTLWSWIKSTATENKNDPKFLGGNAATLLCKLNTEELAGKDLSGTNLSGADLSGANLLGTKLLKTILKNVNLRNAKFLKKDLSSSIISNVTVSVFFVLKEKRTNLSTSDIIKKVVMKMGRGEWSGEVIPTEEFFFSRIEMLVKNMKLLKSSLTKLFSIKEIHGIALYYNEKKALLSLVPDSFKEQFNKILWSAI